MNLIKEFVYRLRGEFTTERLIKMGLKVGDNFGRLSGVIIDPSHCWLIEIGNNVTMAPNVHILAHDASTKNHLGYTKIGKVTIGNNVFIGASTVVLPNVTIGDNVIIGVNSVVTKNIPAGKVVVGNPAKVICDTRDYVEKHRKKMEVSPVYGVEYTLSGNIDGDKKTQMNCDLQDRIGYVV